ncbi:MAG: hypothetical protein GX442_15545 [Candidatus Riflebacteria bacterium]|nr:hypothetical protein [Candidatus Riflebacteria bacterium]
MTDPLAVGQAPSGGPMAGSPVPERLPLRGSLTFPRDRYFALQAAGEALFGRADLPLPEKVLALHQMVSRESRGESLPGAEEAVAAARAAGPGHDDTKARLILGVFLNSLLQTDGQAPVRGGVGLMVSLLFGLAKQVGGFGSLRIPRWEVTVGVNAVQAVPMREIQAEADRAWEALLRQQLANGWLVRYGSVFLGASLLLMEVGLLQWFTRASAVAAGRSAPTGEDVDRALDLVRAELVEAGPGFRLALEGAFSVFYDALLDRPAVAASLACTGR